MKPHPDTLDGIATLSGEGVASEPADASSEAPPEFLSNGDKLGRYVVLRMLGAGAMGAVYLAYDPELDRKVALKQLHRGTDPKKRKGLLREAQAMAKLTHPNVVSVHDAGEHDGTVYVAMEYVRGTTLRKWLLQERRSWRDVLEVFVQAGRGLERAHVRGLIHRDFKPDNVMVSEEGRVCVMDFGLARPGGPATNEAVDDEEDDLSDISGSLLTEATVGKLAGTPAYMAPEQAVARHLSPAVDQFSFCVSLWEGICGRRPFAGLTYGEVFAAASEGRLRKPPPGTRMPRWLRRTLERGMDPIAERRWPSMAALLEALERGRGRWRRTVAVGLVGLLAIPIALWVADRRQREEDERAQLAACDAEGQAVAEVWNDATRRRLRVGFEQSGASFAERTVSTIVPWLDDYAAALSWGRTEVCIQREVEREWTPMQIDRATWCLEDRQLQLEAILEQITGSEKKAARRAVRLASYLDPVPACLDPVLLAKLPAPPELMRDEIRSIRAVLTESDRLRHGGMAAEALEVAADARARAEAVGWLPLVASARFIEGRCTFEAGRLEAADAVLTDAFFDAERASSFEVAFRAARTLVSVQSGLEHYDQAKVWARHADAASATLDDPGRLDEAEGHYLMMRIYTGLGELEAARREGEQAYAIRAETLGMSHPITAAVLRNLGNVDLEAGRPAQALDRLDLAHSIWLRAVGPEHPHTGELLQLRAEATLALGRPDAAAGLAEAALATLEAALAEGHPKIGAALDVLGRVHLAQGRLEDAARELHRALEIRRRALGPLHRDHAASLVHLAAVDRARGDTEQAERGCGEALQTLELTVAADHPRLAKARAACGMSSDGPAAFAGTG